MKLTTVIPGSNFKNKLLLTYTSTNQIPVPINSVVNVAINSSYSLMVSAGILGTILGLRTSLKTLSKSHATSSTEHNKVSIQEKEKHPDDAIYEYNSLEKLMTSL